MFFFPSRIFRIHFLPPLLLGRRLFPLCVLNYPLRSTTVPGMSSLSCPLSLISRRFPPLSLPPSDLFSAPLFDAHRVFPSKTDICSLRRHPRYFLFAPPLFRWVCSGLFSSFPIKSRQDDSFIYVFPIGVWCFFIPVTPPIYCLPKYGVNGPFFLPPSNT